MSEYTRVHVTYIKFDIGSIDQIPFCIQLSGNILVKENSELATERDSLNAEILKLNKDLGKRRADLNKLIQSYDQWDRVVKSKKAEAQNQSNQ